jgi:hypothetical protein
LRTAPDPLFAADGKPTLLNDVPEGYADHATLRGEFLSAGMSMITKLFSLADLASKISELIVHPPASSD